MKTPLNTDKKPDSIKTSIDVPFVRIRQSDFDLFVFKVKASTAWDIFSISRKEPDGNKGYQRFLSTARVSSVSKYINAGNPIPVGVWSPSMMVSSTPTHQPS